MKIKIVKENLEKYSENESFTIYKVVEENEKQNLLESTVEKQG
jgi:hypothetical protein